jgi:hypothetical protein
MRKGKTIEQWTFDDKWREAEAQAERDTERDRETRKAAAKILGSAGGKKSSKNRTKKQRLQSSINGRQECHPGKRRGWPKGRPRKPLAGAGI